MKLTVDSRDRAYVARQPILTTSGDVFGYELLYRAMAEDTTCEEAGERAAARVLNDTLLNVGLDTLTDGKLAFINFNQVMLLANVATLLPPARVIIEVLEGEDVTPAGVDACRALRNQGYTLALDDFEPGSSAEVLLPLASIVKVDVLATTRQQRAAIKRLVPPGVKLLAEKVETAEMFHEMRSDAYDLFQGFYFCRPATVSAEAVSTRHLAYARLLAMLNSPNVSVITVEDLIKHDASLSYRVLRCVNSAAFGVRREVSSIRQALVLLGLDRIRKWASIWAMAGMRNGSSPELVTMAVLRARCCETLGAAAGAADDQAEYFLLGLCSLIDAILGRPMSDAIADLPLSDHVRTALSGGRNPSRSILDAVIAYESGDWDLAAATAAGAGLPPHALAEAYGDALKWARDLSQLMAA
jgi:c-di-GMP-related signal transduction protein